jgi:hypothetical protein
MQVGFNRNVSPSQFLVSLPNNGIKNEALLNGGIHMGNGQIVFVPGANQMVTNQSPQIISNYGQQNGQNQLSYVL